MQNLKPLFPYVSGVVRMRKLKKLPNKKCWFVGCSEMDAVYATSKFNESWESDLTINHHDCRNYVNGNCFNNIFCKFFTWYEFQNLLSDSAFGLKMPKA